MSTVVQIAGGTAVSRREQDKSFLLRAWILSGLFFMVIPGTLLGFSNLLAISAHHGSAGLPSAWMEGHGHAQVFGWIGSFILGIGFYSQPSSKHSTNLIPQLSLLLWSSGVTLRWIGNIYGWHWRVLLPVSSGFELLAVILFLKAASHHKLPETVKGQTATKAPMEKWMISVLMGTAALTAVAGFNFIECLRLAVHGTSRSFPHTLDQKYLVLLGWGFMVPIVWGFSARWLPAFLAIPKPNNRKLLLALALDLLGVLCCVIGWPIFGTILLALSAVVIVRALRLIQKPNGPAKVLGVSSSFPSFIRIAYAWLVIAGSMSFWAACADQHGGIWGASRHALTVGFAATMVFAIGPRILPHFGGIYKLFSTRLMFLSLLFLQVGCTLRVTFEPLAYEGIAALGWRVLPVSGILELTAVLLFAINLSLTFMLGRSMFAQNSPHRSVAS